MPIYFIEGRVILFAHVPKTGGGSVHTILHRLGRSALIFPRRATGMECSPQHFHAEMLDTLFRGFTFDLKFMFTRHPLERLKSEYRMRSEIAKQHGRPPLPDFNTWWKRQLERVKDNPFHLDNHLRPQHQFLMQDMHHKKMEDGLEEGLIRFLSRIDIYLESSRTHVRKHSHIELTIDDTTLDSVRAFYIEDYKTFGYPVETVVS